MDGKEDEPKEHAWVQVSDAPVSVSTQSASVVMTSNGVIFVSWVDQRNGAADTYVTYSEDGGNTFAESVRVDGPTFKPYVGYGDRPLLFVSQDSLYVTMGLGKMHLYESSLAGPLQFGEPIVLPGKGEFIRGAYTPDGDIWLVWLKKGGLGFARKSGSYLLEELEAGFPGVPCECCALDLRFTAEGTGLFAFRNNIDNIRNQYVAIAPAGSGSFTSHAQVSFTDWEQFGCPTQGPRLAETPEGDQLATWSDGSTGDMRVYLSTSMDQGQSWAGDEDVTPGFDGELTHPTIAVGGDGTVFVTADVYAAPAVLVSRSPGQSAFEPPMFLMAPTGEISSPRLGGNGQITAVVGVSESGEVWLKRLD